ncbi:MAG: alpha/beta hydrolase [Hamadaea sp.]|nr:alpha/beta hydrolase [Hamadaea sp.]
MDTTALDQAFPRLDGVTHRFVDLPGLRMHVAEAGQGHPILLLHGFPQHWWEYRALIGPLAEHYRVICPDLRGCGWTEAPADGYDADSLTGDVLHLLDALGVERVHIVAHDWGAIVAFRLALLHPGRVTGLVSMGIPHPYVHVGARMVGRMRHGWYQFPLHTPGLGPRVVGGGRQRLMRYLLRRYSAVPGAISEADLELFLSPLREPAHARAGSEIYRRFILPEGVRMLRGGYRDTRLTTPALVLAGEHDPVIRVDVIGDAAGHADDLTVEEVPGASHFMVDDRPDFVAARTLAFFAAR